MLGNLSSMSVELRVLFINALTEYIFSIFRFSFLTANTTVAVINVLSLLFSHEGMIVVLSRNLIATVTTGYK